MFVEILIFKFLRLNNYIRKIIINIVGRDNKDTLVFFIYNSNISSENYYTDSACI